MTETASNAAESKSQRAEGYASSGAKKYEVPRKQIWCSTVAVVIWVLIFSAGILIETVEYRFKLAPRGVARQLAPEGLTSLKSESAAEPTLSNIKTATSLTSDNKSAKQITDPDDIKHSAIGSFFVALICFTPSNLALLTLTAGFIGDCASSITISTMPPERLAKLGKEYPRRSVLLQEPPISASLRGLVVYFAIIAGVYVVMDDPFKNPTTSQYIRLAGAMSVMAFVVGYDPSRLEDWLRAIPGPFKGSKDGYDDRMPIERDGKNRKTNKTKEGSPAPKKNESAMVIPDATNGSGLNLPR